MHSNRRKFSMGAAALILGAGLMAGSSGTAQAAASDCIEGRAGFTDIPDSLSGQGVAGAGALSISTPRRRLVRDADRQRRRHIDGVGRPEHQRQHFWPHCNGMALDGCHQRQQAVVDPVRPLPSEFGRSQDHDPGLPDQQFGKPGLPCLRAVDQYRHTDQHHVHPLVVGHRQESRTCPHKALTYGMGSWPQAFSASSRRPYSTAPFRTYTVAVPPGTAVTRSASVRLRPGRVVRQRRAVADHTGTRV